MTPDELAAWMASHDYNERELAHELGVNWTTPYKWLSGEMPIRPVVVLALEQVGSNVKAAERRRAVRWTTADLREWMTEHGYDAEDLGYVLDLPLRAVGRLLSAADDAPVERPIVLALRGHARERNVARPKGLDADGFRRWLRNHRRSQKDVVDTLGVSEAAVSRWASVDDATHRGVSPITRLALKTLERKRDARSH